jgi:hypothetical protein
MCPLVALNSGRKFFGNIIGRTEDTRNFFGDSVCQSVWDIVRKPAGGSLNTSRLFRVIDALCKDGGF